MKIILALFSVLMFSVACSSPKEKYNEDRKEAQEEYKEEMEDIEGEYKEEQKEEAVEYVDDSEEATINEKESQVDVVE